MKTAIWIFVMLNCVAYQCKAQVQFSSALESEINHETGFWYSGIASGYYFPIQRFSSSYTFNGGGSYFGGFQLNSHFALQLEWNNWLLSGGGFDTWDLKVGPEFLWHFLPSKNKFEPFLLSGIGLNYQINQPGGISHKNLAFPFGLGMHWYLHERSCLFVEGIYYLIIGKTSTQAVPALLGYSIGF